MPPASRSPASRYDGTPVRAIYMLERVAEIVGDFEVPGTFEGAERIGSGHINDTFAAWFRTDEGRKRILVQHLNTEIFTEPAGLMENIVRVTSHLRDKLSARHNGDLDRHVLRVIPTKSGANHTEDDYGLWWRAYNFIERAKTYDTVESTELAYQAAKAFGGFIADLADFPADSLIETLPNFHNTPRRFEHLANAIREDSCGRVKAAEQEIRFALDRQQIVSCLIEMHERGLLPTRVTHNDTKLNNVMICDDTGEGICVIDLDTVMPGLSLYDFGDMVRTATSRAAEDEEDLDLVEVELEMFEALVAGFLESAGGVLTHEEVEQLAFSGLLITFEIGVRFLTDYLQGDPYFRIHHPDHNLVRARAQFKLARSIEVAMQEMTAIVGRRLTLA